MSHYTITPQQKKSVEVVFELFRELNDNKSEFIVIRELYRWGKGFVEHDLDCNLPYADSSEAYARFDVGENQDADFDDSIDVQFEFDDSISEQEQEQIQQSYYEGGMGWIYDGDHDWQVEDDYVIIYAPFKVELCNEDGAIIKEIVLEAKPDPNTSWPFSKEFPKPESN